MENFYPTAAQKASTSSYIRHLAYNIWQRGNLFYIKKKKTQKKRGNITKTQSEFP